jgi:uncharacterized protein YbjT (DUF2867 family)
MDGVRAVFLLLGDMDDQAAGEIRVVDAAKRAGVKRFVKLSVLAAESEAFVIARNHRHVERAIEASGVPYTFLRPGSFMQNFATYYGEMIRHQDGIFLPCGDAREAHIDARDIARVAALTLTTDGHEGNAYDLLGPEPLTYAEAAEKISAATGRTITYVDISAEDARKAMLEMGMPQDAVDRLLDLYRFIRESSLPPTSSAVKDITGRPPTSFDQFAGDYAAHWKP